MYVVKTLPSPTLTISLTEDPAVITLTRSVASKMADIFCREAYRKLHSLRREFLEDKELSFNRDGLEYFHKYLDTLDDAEAKLRDLSGLLVEAHQVLDINESAGTPHPLTAAAEIAKSMCVALKVHHPEASSEDLLQHVVYDLDKAVGYVGNELKTLRKRREKLDGILKELTAVCLLLYSGNEAIQLLLKYQPPENFPDVPLHDSKRKPEVVNRIAKSYQIAVCNQEARKKEVRRQKEKIKLMASFAEVWVGVEISGD